jgi:hypothetical protein
VEKHSRQFHTNQKEEQESKMKKKMIALLAGALMMFGASSAFAAFSSANMEVYRVVYDGTTGSTFEAMTDLGSLATLQADAGGTLLDSGTSSFAGLTGYNQATDKVVYFAFNTATKSVYISQTGEGSNAPASNPTKWASAGIPLKTVITTAYASGTTDASGMTSTITGGTGNTSSFKGKGYGGSFGGYLSGNASTLFAASLANLATTDVTHLYFFNGDTGIIGTVALSLTTNAVNGTTSIAATPIPPAFFLMGSGLLGMFGLRRKQRG